MAVLKSHQIITHPYAQLMRSNAPRDAPHRFATIADATAVCAVFEDLLDSIGGANDLINCRLKTTIYDFRAERGCAKQPRCSSAANQKERTRNATPQKMCIKN